MSLKPAAVASFHQQLIQQFLDNQVARSNSILYASRQHVPLCPRINSQLLSGQTTTQCRRAAKQIAATYTHRSFFIYIHAGHRFGKHHVAAKLESILGSAAELVSSLVNTATASGNADWSPAAQSTNSTTYMVPFISFTYTQGSSLLPR